MGKNPSIRTLAKALWLFLTFKAELLQDADLYLLAFSPTVTKGNVRLSMCIHNGLLCFMARSYNGTLSVVKHKNNEMLYFVRTHKKTAVNLCNPHNTRRAHIYNRKKKLKPKAKKRFTITVYIRQATEMECKENKGTEKQKVYITQVNTLELCKLLWYNMGQRKTDGKKGSETMTETENRRTETGTETGEKKPDNRRKTAQQRDKNGRFVKGVSGNPSGRPSMPTDVKQRLISLLPKAIDTIQAMIEDEKVKPEVRIKAAEMVVERNLGKAVVPVLTETVGEGSTLTLAEMIACAKDLLGSE